jgi:hypothetical protein
VATAWTPDVRVEPGPLAEQAQGLGHDEQARLVVEGPRRRAPAQERLEPVLESRHVPQSDDGLGLGAGARADVDPKVAHLRLRLELVLIEKVDRFVADHARHALAAVHPDPLADRDDAVVPAYGPEVEQPLLADVVDGEADLVHVPGEHHLDGGVRVERRGDVADTSVATRSANRLT